MRARTSLPLVVLFLLVTACVSLPPERVADRERLSAAAAKCAPQYSAVERWEIDSFDRVVAWYKENKSQAELQPFFDCVRARVREEGGIGAVAADRSDSTRGARNRHDPDRAHRLCRRRGLSTRPGQGGRGGQHLSRSPAQNSLRRPSEVAQGIMTPGR
jgi:hypothetical protein